MLFWLILQHCSKSIALLGDCSKYSWRHCDVAASMTTSPWRRCHDDVAMTTLPLTSSPQWCKRQSPLRLAESMCVILCVCGERGVGERGWMRANRDFSLVTCDMVTTHPYPQFLKRCLILKLSYTYVPIIDWTGGKPFFSVVTTTFLVKVLSALGFDLTCWWIGFRMKNYYLVIGFESDSPSLLSGASPISLVIYQCILDATPAREKSQSFKYLSIIIFNI